MKKLLVRIQVTRHLVPYTKKFVISGFVTQGFSCYCLKISISWRDKESEYSSVRSLEQRARNVHDQKE